MKSACARRMYLLEYGEEPVPKLISIKGGSRILYWEPIIGIVVESEDGWTLLETGIGARLLADSDALEQLYPGPHKPTALNGEPLKVALAGVGLSPEDLVLAAVSHLHCDHSGGVRLLSEHGVPIAIQREELAFASDGASVEDGYYPPDYREFDVQWLELDGDAELAPGVWAIATPGHAPGHMSYRVDLPETGSWLFAVDAADLGENVLEGVPPGQTVQVADGERATASLQRLTAEARRIGARLIPGHDRVVWTAVRHPVGGHR